MKVIQLDVTTDGDGAGTATAVIGSTPGLAEGGLLTAIEWNVGTLSAGVDATLTVTSLNGTAYTVATLTNADSDAWYYPRIIEVDSAGNTLTSSSRPYLRGTITLTVASGGATKAGTAYLHVLET